MEEWRVVKGFEEYKVSNEGRVRRVLPDSLGRPTKILKPNPISKGYLQVKFYRKGCHPKNFLVHVLVAKAFVSNPLGLPEVNHLGENWDNRASMLEWRSSQGNMQHAVLTGRKAGIGVSFIKKNKKWRAEYSPVPNRRVYLGEFNTKEEAAEVREDAIKSIAYVP